MLAAAVRVAAQGVTADGAERVPKAQVPTALIILAIGYTLVNDRMTQPRGASAAARASRARSLAAIHGAGSAHQDRTVATRSCTMFAAMDGHASDQLAAQSKRAFGTWTSYEC